MSTQNPFSLQKGAGGGEQNPDRERIVCKEWKPVAALKLEPRYPESGPSSFWTTPFRTFLQILFENSSRLRRVLRGGAEGSWRNLESRERRGMNEAREGYPLTSRISDLQLVGSQACVYTRVMQSIMRTEEPNRGLGISNSIDNNWCLLKCTHGPTLCCFTLPSFRVGPNYCPVLQMENCTYKLVSASNH